jgi:hypothetical protein
MFAQAPAGRAAPSQAARPASAAPEWDAANTAAIAAAAGFVDVLGVKLGTPLKDALGILKAHNPQFKTNAFVTSSFQLLPTTPLVTTVIARTRLYDDIGHPLMKPGDMGETVVLRLTQPPNAPFVFHIVRQVAWMGRKGPLVDAVLAGLREKYGARPIDGGHSVSVGTVRLTWLFDAQEHLMPPTPSGKIDCALAMSLDAQIPQVDLRDDQIEQNREKSGLVQQVDGVVNAFMQEGFDARTASDSIVTGCRAVTVITATVHVEPANGVVADMSVEALSLPLLRASFNASHDMLAQAAAKGTGQEQDAARKRAAPKM